MEFPIRRIDSSGAEIELEYTFRCLVVSCSELRNEIPVAMIFIVIILTLCGDVERQSPVERPLRADIDTRHIFAEAIIEIRVVGNSVITSKLTSSKCTECRLAQM